MISGFVQLRLLSKIGLVHFTQCLHYFMGLGLVRFMMPAAVFKLLSVDICPSTARAMQVIK